MYNDYMLSKNVRSALFQGTINPHSDRKKSEATIFPTPDVPPAQPHISGNSQTYNLSNFYVNSIIFGILIGTYWKRH